MYGAGSASLPLGNCMARRLRAISFLRHSTERRFLFRLRLHEVAPAIPDCSAS